MGFAELVEAAHQASTAAQPHKKRKIKFIDHNGDVVPDPKKKKIKFIDYKGDVQDHKRRKIKLIDYKGDIQSTTAEESTLSEGISECIDSFSDADHPVSSTWPRKDAIERDFLKNYVMAYDCTTPSSVQYKYKCKTCNKSFPTPRALGGHRSSHTYNQMKEDLIRSSTTGDNLIPSLTIGDIQQPTISSGSGNHRCKICNKSFPTGQALGGHKRLHWNGFQASAAKRLLTSEMGCRKMLDNRQCDDQTGEDGINLELTL